jgi:hypothetical protein
MIKVTNTTRVAGRLDRSAHCDVRRFPVERRIAARGRRRSPCVAAARGDDPLRSRSHKVRQIRTQRPRRAYWYRWVRVQGRRLGRWLKEPIPYPMRIRSDD